MLISSSQAIEDCLHEQIVKAGVAPGACAAVSVRQQEQWWTWVAASGTCSGAGEPQLNVQTWFDLASITKSVVAFCLLRSASSGHLDLQAPLQELLPWSRGSFAGEASLEQLASHRAGLLPHVALYAPLQNGLPWSREQALLSAVHSHNPERRALPEGGFEAVYSDLGYVLLGEALSTLHGRALDVLVAEELSLHGVKDLGSARQLGLQLDPNVAPTEDVPWRGGLLKATVHDENAFALAGSGCAGHAGLFGRAVAVARFAALMLDLHQGRSQCLSPALRERFFQMRAGGTLRLGFDGKSAGASMLGTQLGARTFGHFGFTGTGFWCDPDQELCVVLLTNRVCPSRQNVGIREARPVIHDRLVELGRQLRRSSHTLAHPNHRPVVG